MSEVTKPILLDETGQEIVSKLNDIKDAIGTSSEFIPVKIQVVTPPTKTAYMVGEQLDLTGLVVNLVGINGVQVDVTSACTFSPANGTTLTSTDDSVSITYEYQHDSSTFTTSQALSIAQIDTISVYNAPTKTHYRAGESLDLTGIVVKALYDNGSSIDVTADCVFSPSNGSVLTSNDNEVSVSYTNDGTTYTTTQGIRVDYLFGISVTAPPTKTTYATGESLDLTGIVVTATYTDTNTAVVTSSCTYVPANGTTLSTDDATVSISYTEAGITKTTTQSITVSTPIYGVEWDGSSSPVWTRTDDAVSFVDPVPYVSGMSGQPSSPFDNIMPWSGMQIVEDQNAGTLVSIPKFYYKITQAYNSDDIKIQICSSPQEGFAVSPAHMDRGDGQGERDVVYVGRYHCGSSNYKSATGATPKNRVSVSSARTSIHNLGTDIWQYDYATWFTIQLLYLVEYANWDSQSILGYGCNADTDTLQTMGYTDNMPYHTGTMQTSKTTWGVGIQYRYIEGLWDNVLDHIDGSRFTSDGLYIIMNPSEFSNEQNGVFITLPASGYPTALALHTVTGAFPVIIPNAGGGSNSTYVCDLYGYGTTYDCMMTGGQYGGSSSLSDGLFYLKGWTSANSSRADTGCRLIKLPNAS